MNFTFKVGKNIKKAWALYKENFVLMSTLSLFTLLLQFLSQSYSRNHDGNLLITIIISLLSFLLSYIWLKATLNLLDGKGFNPFTKETVSSFAQIWDFFKTNILIALLAILSAIPFIIVVFIAFILLIKYGVSFLFFGLILFGLVLFIFPTLYISSRLFPAKYLSIEKVQGARKSVKESWKMTKGNGWKILWKSILIFLFVMLGFIALFIGLFITYPIAIIVVAMMYRELYKLSNHSSGVKSEAPSKEESVQEVEVKVSEEDK